MGKTARTVVEFDNFQVIIDKNSNPYYVVMFHKALANKTKSK